MPRRYCIYCSKTLVVIGDDRANGGFYNDWYGRKLHIKCYKMLTNDMSTNNIDYDRLSTFDGLICSHSYCKINNCSCRPCNDCNYRISLDSYNLFNGSCCCSD